MRPALTSRVFARSVVVVLLGVLSGSCGSSSVAPTPPVDYSGTWTGSYRLANAFLCYGVYPPPADATYTVTLVLSQSGTTVGGGVDSGMVCGFSFGSTQATGPVDPHSGFTITGQHTEIGDGCFGLGKREYLYATTVGADGIDPQGRLTGGFTFTATHGLTSCYYSDQTIVGQFVDVRRQ